MKPILFAFCAFALLAPYASAQVYDPETKPLPPLDAAHAVIGAALETMRSGAEVPPKLFQSLRAAGGTVEVQAGQSQPCVLTEKNVKGVKSPLILCSDSLGSKPMDYAVFYISEQVGRMVAADMPECAEKEYMALSLGARSWIEAGGQVMADRPAADRLQEWWKAFGMKAYLAKHAERGQATLAGLMAANLQAQKDAGRSESQLAALRAEQARLKAAQAQAAAFASDESEWLKRWNTFEVK
jgi:hypothetical protein